MKNNENGLTTERAYELALLKWQNIVDNDGKSYGLYRLVDKYPEFFHFPSNCSYCELFVHKPKFRGCKGCPLRPKRKTCVNLCGCDQPNHPYQKWVCSRTKENAQTVLDLIIKTKPF